MDIDLRSLNARSVGTLKAPEHLSVHGQAFMACVAAIKSDPVARYLWMSSGLFINPGNHEVWTFAKVSIPVVDVEKIKLMHNFSDLSKSHSLEQLSLTYAWAASHLSDLIQVRQEKYDYTALFPPVPAGAAGAAAARAADLFPPMTPQMNDQSASMGATAAAARAAAAAAVAAVAGKDDVPMPPVGAAAAPKQQPPVAVEKPEPGLRDKDDKHPRRQADAPKEAQSVEALLQQARQLRERSKRANGPMQELTAGLANLQMASKEARESVKHDPTPAAKERFENVKEDMKVVRGHIAHENNKVYGGTFIGLSNTVVPVGFITLDVKNHVGAGRALSTAAIPTPVQVYCVRFTGEHSDRPFHLLVREDQYVGIKNAMGTSTSTAKNVSTSVYEWTNEFEMLDRSRVRLIVMNGKTIFALNKDSDEKCAYINELFEKKREQIAIQLYLNSIGAASGQPAAAAAAASAGATPGHTSNSNSSFTTRDR